MTDIPFLAKLKSHIREVPDFPIPGVLFKDISPVFLNPELVEACINHLAEKWKDQGITKVIGIDSRGFLLGPQIASRLDAGFVMVRKKGKLPPETISVTYELEYGEATLESVRESLSADDKVIIHDDLLATGGTASAAADLCQTLGAQVVGFSFIIDLDFLPGKEKLAAYGQPIHALISYYS
jgi:adenine phosphoribosyltransferase